MKAYSSASAAAVDHASFAVSAVTAGPDAHNTTDITTVAANSGNPTRLLPPMLIMLMPLLYILFA